MLKLARRQHGGVARRQLLAIGFSAQAVRHALATGRLHRTEWRGVYAVGRPEPGKLGRLSAALLYCGDRSVLMGEQAGGLWGIWKPRGRRIHVAVPAADGHRSRGDLVVHRRSLRRRDVTHHYGLRVTTPLRTVVDLAAGREGRTVERLVNQADARNILRADTLRAELADLRGDPGVPLLTAVLDRDQFVLTESELERLFLPLARRAGLPKPESQRRLGRGRVDFWFPELNLVVECDSLRYHRTVQQQAEDRARDHEHFRAKRDFVRFTHHDIAHEPTYVVETLRPRSAPSSSPSAA